MITKYNSCFDEKVVQTDLRRLVNQIWKLLPMKEKEENWEKQLSSVLIELHGLHEMFDDQLKLLILDEPTAVLTEKEAEALLQSIRNMAEKGIAVIFITHRLHEILAEAFKKVTDYAYIFILMEF